MGQGGFAPGLVSVGGQEFPVFARNKGRVQVVPGRICPSHVPSIFASVPGWVGQGLEVGHEGLQPRSQSFSCRCRIHPFLLQKKASPLGAVSTHGRPASQPALPSFPGWVLWGQAPWSPVGPGARGQEPQAHGFACILGKRVPRSQWSQCCGPGWEPGRKGLWGPS